MGQRWVLHPFLFAVFPILALFAHNVYETPPREIVQPIAIVLAATLVVWLAWKGLLGDGRRAGFVTSILVFLFFTVAQIHIAAGQVLTFLSQFWVSWEYEVE